MKRYPLILVFALWSPLALAQHLDGGWGTPSGASLAETAMFSSGESMVSTDAFGRILGAINPADQAGCMAGETVEQSYKVNGKQVNSTRKVSRMPDGYFNGMIISFARNQCELGAAKEPFTGATFMGRLQQSTDLSQSGDTIKHYQASPYGRALNNVDPMISNYALMLPLGMLESSGNYGEGIDQQTSSGKNGTEVEAGLFQVSQNSINLGSPTLADTYLKLLNKYAPGSDPALCMNKVFQKGANIKISANTGINTPTSAEFQMMMKNCPAMAVDYMAALLRTNHNHNGPLNRYEARPRQACVSALTAIKREIGSGQFPCDGLNSITDGSFNSSQYVSRMKGISAKIGAAGFASFQLANNSAISMVAGQQAIDNSYLNSANDMSNSHDPGSDRTLVEREAAKNAELIKMQEQMSALSDPAKFAGLSSDDRMAQIEGLQKQQLELRRLNTIQQGPPNIDAITRINAEIKGLRLQLLDLLNKPSVAANAEVREIMQRIGDLEAQLIELSKY